MTSRRAGAETPRSPAKAPSRRGHSPVWHVYILFSHQLPTNEEHNKLLSIALYNLPWLKTPRRAFKEQVCYCIRAAEVESKDEE